MDVNKTNEVMEILNKIMEYELSGVVRYTHYALMITGRDRLSLAQFFKDQASESLLHAQEAGEIVTGLGGHPSLKIQIIEESNKHSTIDLLNESSEHEKEAVGLTVRILSPFGSQLAKMTWQEGHAHLQVTGQPDIYSDAIEETLVDYTGWMVSVSDLLSWVVGKLRRPSP